VLASESELFIFSDGPRNEKDKVGVEEVRRYIKTISGFKMVHIIEKKQNDGLAKSIITGVTDIINKYGTIIVLEDDIVTSQYFLHFMNDALRLYENNNTVMHISGYFYPNATNLPPTFFYNQMLCWGWATWKRAWVAFSSDIDTHIKTISSQPRLNSTMYLKNALSQLKANKEGKIKTWAVKWQSSIIKKEGFCLNPNVSYTNNIGHDGTGEHCNISHIFDTNTCNIYTPPKKIEIMELKDAVRFGNKFLRKVRGPLWKRIISRLKK
jgi:hypothetical protein